MHRGLKISVVIPCYNEEEGVRYVIERLPDCVDEVVVVDNNSTDRTAEVATSLGARVVFEGRKGYGSAYKAGLPAATGDIIVTLDGDGTYPSEQIPELVDHLEDRHLDFISAARFPLKNPKSMSFSNKVGNMVLSITMLLLYGVPIKDSQSGMWVIRTRILPGLRLTSDGMPLSEEIKIEAIRAKDVAFAEYHVNYHPRVGEVKLEKWRDGFRNLAFLFKKRFG
jgi:glycosyltransferase involved in cell wall biosynthesis